MCDTMGTINLVLRVAPNGVPTVRGPLLRGIRCQAVREMLLPCPPRGYSAADATAQCPKAKRPVGVGVGCLSRGGSWVSPWQELLLLSCWNVSSPPPESFASCPLSLLNSPIPPSAGSPTPTHNRTDSSQARRESLHHNYSMAASENLRSESLLWN